MAGCLNCGTNFTCSCQERTSINGKKCCSKCVDQLNMLVNSNGADVPQATIEAPTKYLVPIKDNLKIKFESVRTLNTPVITSVRYMNFNK